MQLLLKLFMQLIQNEISPEILQTKAYFDAFLKGQLMPFELEEPEPIPLLKNILEIILKKDISRVGDITSTDKDQIRNLIRIMAKSEGVDGISYTSISKNIGATKYKVMQYVNLLEKAFILIQLQPYGSSVTKEPKILLAPPYRLLEKSFENAIGGLREDYFVFTMQGFLRSNFDNLKYLKSIRGAKTPDFLVKT